jgi:CDP-glucose 4,6-dehydratase
VGVSLFGGRYAGRRVLLTGHTGFKGSWLALWLAQLGAEVTGVALPPEGRPNHWELLGLDVPSHLLDLRDARAIAQVTAAARPEIVFHLAAQPLVRRSYADPLETWSTNVMGTANLLQACRQVEGLRAIVVVTSDKCYENRETDVPYAESDRLGGHDPYSASKAATELVAASYRQAFFGESPLLATARAGNVIGGGDWSVDRLIPDLVRALASREPLVIRSPRATRPWQHVLDSLAGYLRLGQQLLEGERGCAQAWNFGPATGANCAVADILSRMAQLWPQLRWEAAAGSQPHEARLLALDSTQAREHLGWRSVWDLDTTLQATAEWYRTFLADGRPLSRQQLARYLADAERSGEAWCSA